MTRGLLVVPALLLSCVFPALAQDKEADKDDKDQAYKQGLDAREKKDNYRQVADLMRQAIAARGTESLEKVKRGLERFRPGAGTEYTPHYFLAEALWKLDDCAGAMNEWWISEQQGVIQKTDRAGWMKDGYAACEKKGFLKSPNLEQAVTGANAEISKAAALAEAVSNRAKTAGDLYNAQHRAQFDEASALIRDARNKVDSLRKSRVATELTESTSAQRKANGILALLFADLDALIAKRASAVSDLAGLERAIDEANGIDTSIEPKQAYLTASLFAKRMQGRDALMRARRIAEAFRGSTSADAASLAEGRSQVSIARGHFRQVLDEALELERKDREKRLGAQLRLTRQKFTFLDRGFKNFDSRVAARPDTDPNVIAERKALEKSARGARKGLEAAATAGDSPAIETAGRTADEIGGKLEKLNLTFGKLTLVERGVPKPLADATEQYLSGNFSGAIETLKALEKDGRVPTDTPLLEHAYLFRAAANYELSLRAGSGGKARLDEAKSALSELYSLNPGFEPEARYFSLKFVAFFRASRPAASTVSDPPPSSLNP